MRVKVGKEYLLSLVAVILGLVAGAILMRLTGHSPIEGYLHLFRGGTMNIERIGNTLATATPLIFTGLAVAFAFKTGLFNIGASGQMLMGGLGATAVGLTFAWPKPLLLTVMMLVSLFAGGLWGAISGWLKATFNVHEVVSSIMMNWIAFWTVYYTIPKYFKGPFLETESRGLPVIASLRVTWLTDLFQGSYISLGIVIAIVAVFIVAFILDRTTLGYELKAVGHNKHAAQASGINVNQKIILSMAMAGALAGLGGASFYAGFASNMQIGVLPSQGFDGMAVALLAASSPWGVFSGAIFFGILHTGKGFMNAMTNIPPEIADTIIATIIYFAATSVLVERLWERLKKKKLLTFLTKSDDGAGGGE